MFSSVNPNHESSVFTSTDKKTEIVFLYFNVFHIFADIFYVVNMLAGMQIKGKVGHTNYSTVLLGKCCNK